MSNQDDSFFDYLDSISDAGSFFFPEAGGPATSRTPDPLPVIGFKGEIDREMSADPLAGVPKKKRKRSYDLGLGRTNIDAPRRRQEPGGFTDPISMLGGAVGAITDRFYESEPVPSAMAGILKGVRSQAEKQYQEALAEYGKKPSGKPPKKMDAEAVVFGGAQAAEAREFERRINPFREQAGLDPIQVAKPVETPEGTRVIPATAMEAYRAGVRVAPPVIKTKPPVDESGLPLLDEQDQPVLGGEELVSRRIQKRMRDAARPESQKPLAVPGGLPQEELDVLPGMPTVGEEVTPEQIEESQAKGEDPAFIGLMDEEVEVPFMENPKMDSLTIQLNPFIYALSFLNETAASVRSKPTRQFAREGLDITPGISTEGGAGSFAVGAGRKSVEALQGKDISQLALGLLDRIRNPYKIFDEDIKLYKMGDRYRDQEPGTGEITKYEDSALGKFKRFRDASARGLKHFGRDATAIALGLPLMFIEAVRGIGSGRSLEETIDRGVDVGRFMGTEFARAYVEPANAVEDGTLMWFSTVTMPFAKKTRQRKQQIADDIYVIRETINYNQQELAKKALEVAEAHGSGRYTAESAAQRAVNAALINHNNLVQQLKNARGEYKYFAALDGLQAVMGNNPLGIYDMSVSLLKYWANTHAAGPKGVNKRWWIESPTERLPLPFVNMMRDRITMARRSEYAVNDALQGIPVSERPSALVHMYMEHVDSPQTKLPDGTPIYDVLDLSADRRANPNLQTSLIRYEEPSGGMPGQFVLSEKGKQAAAKSAANANHLNNELDLANRYSRPLADTIGEYSKRAKEHGLLTENSLKIWFPQQYPEGKRAARKIQKQLNLASTQLDDAVSVGYGKDLASLQRNTLRQAAIDWAKKNEQSKNPLDPSQNPFSIDRRISEMGMITDMHTLINGRVNGLINVIHEAEFSKQLVESDYVLTAAQMKAMGDQITRLRRQSAEAQRGGQSALAKDLKRQADSLNELVNTYVQAPKADMLNLGKEGGVPDYFYLNGILEVDKFGNKTWRPRKGDERLFVQGDIMLEMINIQEFKKQMSAGYGSAYNAMKEVYTIGSPSTHRRNAIGMWLYLSTMSGVSTFNPNNLKYWKQAFEDLTAPNLKSRSPDFELAYGAGAFDGTNVSELNTLASQLEPFRGAFGSVQALNKAWYSFLEDYQTDVARGSGKTKAAGKAAAAKLAATPGAAFRTTRETLRGAYAGADNLMRAVHAYKQIDLLRKSGNLNEQTLRDAMAKTRYQTIDYGDIPGYAQVLRAPVVPFLLKTGSKYRRNVGSQVGALLEKGKPYGAIGHAFLAKPFFVYPIQAMQQEARFRGNHPVRYAMYQHFLDFLNRKNLVETGASVDASDAMLTTLPDSMQNSALSHAVFGPEYATATPPDIGPPPPIDTEEYQRWLKEKSLRTHKTISGQMDPVMQFSNVITHMPQPMFVYQMGAPADANALGAVSTFIAKRWLDKPFLIAEIIEIAKNYDEYRQRQVFEGSKSAPVANSLVEIINTLVRNLAPNFIGELEGVPGLTDVIDYIFEKETRPEGEFGEEAQGFQRVPGVNAPRLTGGSETNRDLMAERGRVTSAGDVLTPEQRELEVATGTRILGRTGRQSLNVLISDMNSQIGSIRTSAARIMGVPKSLVSKSEGEREAMREADVQQVIRSATLMKDFMEQLTKFASAENKKGVRMYPEAARVLRAAKRFDSAYKSTLKGSGKRKKGLQDMTMDEQKRALRRPFLLLEQLQKSIRREKKKYRKYTGKRVRTAQELRKEPKAAGPEKLSPEQQAILDELLSGE